MSNIDRSISGFGPYTHMLVRAADILVVALAGWFAYWLRFDSVFMTERYQWALVIGMCIASLILPSFSLYKSWRGKLRVILAMKVVVAFLFVGSILSVVVFFSGKSVEFSRIWVMSWMILSALFSVVMRGIAYPLLNIMRMKGANRKTVMLIGDAHSCATAYQHLQRVPSAGFDVARILVVGEDEHGELADREFEIHVPGEKITDHEAEIWICLPISEGATVRKIQKDLSFSTSNLRYMPNLSDLRLINHRISNVADLYMMDLSCSPMTGWNSFCKSILDRSLACLILLMISPVMLIVAIGVKMSSSGPVFYRQERVGWNGKPFDILKFRSMPMDIEQSGVHWGGAKHKKLSRFGKFIRSTSLDELPQFINVFNGNMSIVGPRPERTVFVEKFKSEIPGYMQKHMVKAGITGWAQINGWRGDTDLEKRIECDLWYIENWSIILDLKIIFMTIFKGFVHRNAA
ncbi:undecaprenyl-phosphate glucose phosphotransferase [Cobetia sp. L2A1]|uniref:undecaprenyl-phosphate glucose phosphotransferase n=1 Tax=Cobetia sp. L2A1 TaxID=2686360 RepID=UPI001E54B49D|nr:undecaprenyl-phosphate glucose phosphotransferase [Cobetia sp. L2A1]